MMYLDLPSVVNHERKSIEVLEHVMTKIRFNTFHISKKGTLLHHAVHCEQPKIIDYLVDMGVQIDAVNADG